MNEDDDRRILAAELKKALERSSGDYGDYGRPSKPLEMTRDGLDRADRLILNNDGTDTIRED